MYEKTINLSLSALHLPAVSILIAIGWQGLLLALHNWLRWGITKQEHIPWSGLGSTCSWAQAKEKGHPYGRIGAESLSQMFPFERSASELVVLICGLKSLNTLRFFCFSECENAPRKKFTAWRHMRISDAWSSIMEWSEGSVVFRSFKCHWGGRQFKQKVKKQMQKENNFILILKLYWQHHEEGIISAPNSGESISLIFLWNNPCAINVNTIFCDKEDFIIWMHFETLQNAVGLLHLCNGV